MKKRFGDWIYTVLGFILGVLVVCGILVVWTFIDAVQNRENNVKKSQLFARTHTKIIQENVYDNEQDMVYIDVTEARDGRVALAEITKKKKAWQKQFPNKKIISISLATGFSGKYASPKIFGLLIYYQDITALKKEAKTMLNKEQRDDLKRKLDREHNQVMPLLIN